jgi:hypothetical protein
MKTFSILKSLSPPELGFLRTEKVAAGETPDEWISFFRKVLEFDQKADATRKKLMVLGVLSLLAAPLVWFAISFFFLLFIPVDYAIIAFVPAFLAAFLTLIISIFAFYKYFKLRKYDLRCNDLIKNRMIPLLQLLREEVKRNQKVDLKLDLTNPQDSSKFIKQSPAYAKGVYHKVIDSDYRNDWLSGQTVLADGTILNWKISELIRQIKKTKRNYRGKYKTKYKYKNKTLIQIDAGLERKNFLLPPGLKQKGSEGKIRTKKQGKYDWIQIRKIIKHDGGEFNIKYFIDTVASIYMRAKPNLAGK